MKIMEPNIDNTLNSGLGPPSFSTTSGPATESKVKDKPFKPCVSFDVSVKKTPKVSKDEVDIEGLKKNKNEKIIKKEKGLLKLFRKNVKKEDKTRIIAFTSDVPLVKVTRKDIWEDEDEKDPAVLKKKKEEHDIERAKRLCRLYQYYKEERFSGIRRVRASWIQRKKFASRTSTIKHPSDAVSASPLSSSSYYTVDDSKVPEDLFVNNDANNVNNNPIPEDTQVTFVSPIAINVEDKYESFSGSDLSTSSDGRDDLESILDLFPTLPPPESIDLNKDVDMDIKDDVDNEAYDDEDNECNRSWSSDGTQDGDLGDILDLFPVLPQIAIPNLKATDKADNGEQVCKKSGELEEMQGELITDSNTDVLAVERVLSKDIEELKVQNKEIRQKSWYEQDNEEDEEEDHMSQSSSCSRFSTLDFKKFDAFFPIPGIWIVVSDYDEDKEAVVNVKLMKEKEVDLLDKDHNLETLTLNSGPCNFYFPIPGVWIHVSAYEDDLRKADYIKCNGDLDGKMDEEDLHVVEGEDANTVIMELPREIFEVDKSPSEEHPILNQDSGISTNLDQLPSVSLSPILNTSDNQVNTEYKHPLYDNNKDESDTAFSGDGVSIIDLLGLFPSVTPIVIVKTKPAENVVEVGELITWVCKSCMNLVQEEDKFGLYEDIWHNPWTCEELRSDEGRELQENVNAYEKLNAETIALYKDELEDGTTTSNLLTTDSSSTFNSDRTLKAHTTPVKSNEYTEGGTDGREVVFNAGAEVNGKKNGKQKLWYECDDADDEEEEECMSQSSSHSDFSTSDFQFFDVHFPIPDIWIVVSNYDKDTLKSRGGDGRIEDEFEEKGHFYQTLALNSGSCNVYFPVPGIWICVSVYEEDFCTVNVGGKVVEYVGEEDDRCLEELKKAKDDAGGVEDKPLREGVEALDADGSLAEYRLKHHGVNENFQICSIAQGVTINEAEKEEAKQEEKAEENQHDYNSNSKALIIRRSRALQRIPRRATNISDTPYLHEGCKCITSTVTAIPEEEHGNASATNGHMALILRGPREVQRLLSRECSHSSHVALILRGPREVQWVRSRTMIPTNLHTVAEELDDLTLNEDRPLCQDLVIYTAKRFLHMSSPLATSTPIGEVDGSHMITSFYPSFISPSNFATAQHVSEIEIGSNFKFDILLHLLKQFFIFYLTIIAAVLAGSFIFVRVPTNHLIHQY